MPLLHVHPADYIAIVGVIDPDAYSSGTQSSGWIDVRDLLSVMLIAQTGTQAGGQTYKFQQATDSSGAGAKDVTGAAVTLKTVDNVQYVVSLDVSRLDVDGGFRYVRAQAQSTGTFDGSVLVLGIPNRSVPATDLNLESVTEVVRV